MHFRKYVVETLDFDPYLWNLVFIVALLLQLLMTLLDHFSEGHLPPVSQVAQTVQNLPAMQDLRFSP